MRNTFGTLFRLTTFGESHGEAIGGVVDGYPAGIDIDQDFIQHELDRRRPGQSAITTAPSASSSGTPTSGQATMTKCATCCARRTPTSPTT